MEKKEPVVIIDHSDLKRKKQLEDVMSLPKDLRRIMFSPIVYRVITLSCKDSKVYCVEDEIQLVDGPNGCYRKRKVIEGLTYDINARKIFTWSKRPLSMVENKLIFHLMDYMGVHTPKSKEIKIKLGSNITPGMLVRILEGKIQTVSDVMKHIITYKLKTKGVTQKYYREFFTFYTRCSSLYNACMLIRASKDPCRFLEKFYAGNNQTRKHYITNTSVTMAEKAIKLGEKIDWTSNPRTVKNVNWLEKNIDFIHDLTHLWISNDRSGFKKSIKNVKFDFEDMPF